MKLNNRSLYNQAKGEIIKLIKNDYTFMEKLPSEQQLAEMMGISRNTTREALKSLENEGVIVSRHGVGNFVVSSTSHLQHNIAVLNSTTDIISNNGYRPGTKSVYYDTRLGSENVQRHTKLPAEQQYLYIERVRTANDKPIAYVEDYIPLFDGLLESFASNKEAALFPFLDALGMSVSFSNCTIHAALSEGRAGQLLALEKITSLLKLQQTHFSNKGDLILYSDSYFLSNELEFSLIRRCLD